MRFFKIRDKQEGKDVVHVWIDDPALCRVEAVKIGSESNKLQEIRIFFPGFFTSRYELVDRNFDEFHWCPGCKKRVYWQAGNEAEGNIFDGKDYWHARCFKGDPTAGTVKG